MMTSISGARAATHKSTTGVAPVSATVEEDVAGHHHQLMAALMIDPMIAPNNEPIGP